MGQGAAVDVLEFAAQRYTVGNSADIDAGTAGMFGDEVGGGFAFDGQIGREDEFTDVLFVIVAVVSVVLVVVLLEV